MKSLCILLLTLFCLPPCLAEDFDARLADLNTRFESLLAEIRTTDDAGEKARRFDQLRASASAWHPFPFLYTVNGSDDLQEEQTEEILVSAVYAPFTAEQAHYERCILHTDGSDERARELMGMRAMTVCRLYPIGTRRSLAEDVAFAQLMFRTYPHASGAVSKALHANLSRWTGEERLTALCILAREGSEPARAELAGFESDRARALSTMADAYLNRMESRTEPKTEAEGGPAGKTADPGP